jgi:hypothetical protein
MRRRFELYFDCDNDSFTDPGLVAGIKRTLKLVRWMIGNSFDLSKGNASARTIMDGNGNTVGEWRYRVMPDHMRIVGVLGLWYGDTPLPEGWRFMFDQDKKAKIRFITNMEGGPSYEPR